MSKGTYYSALLCPLILFRNYASKIMTHTHTHTH